MNIFVFLAVFGIFMAVVSILGAFFRIMDGKSTKSMYICTIIFVFIFAIGMSGL